MFYLNSDPCFLQLMFFFFFSIFIQRPGIVQKIYKMENGEMGGDPFPPGPPYIQVYIDVNTVSKRNSDSVVFGRNFYRSIHIL